MARDNTARDGTGQKSSIDRRSFLGVAGTGVASALGVGTLANASEAVDAADYRTITVPAGATKTISVGSGETLENVLIDMTANGASAKIFANGSGWAIRNVAFKGNHPGGHYLFTPAVSKGGTATVENLYMGDGQTEGSAKGGIWVNASQHYGTLNFRNVHIAQMIDNGLYGTGPGTQRHGGVINVYDSFFNSNNIANIRVGSYDGRTCHVENCVVRTGSTRGCGAGCSSPGAKNPRGVWAWWGPVEVSNSDIDGSPPRLTQTSRAGDPEIISKNTRWGADANTSRVPDGVPMTAEEAASGTSSGGSNPDQPSTPDEPESGKLLELIAGSDTSSVTYEFTVDGSVEKRTSGDNSAEANDEMTDNGDGTVTVNGVSGNGYGDTFVVDGDVTAMDLNESEWTVRYDGEEVSPSDFSLPNKLVIDGTDSPNGLSEYTFTVSGSARKSAELGSKNAYDTVSEGEITGRVVGGKDGYRYSGDITSFTLTGPAEVRVEDND